MKRRVSGQTRSADVEIEDLRPALRAGVVAQVYIPPNMPPVTLSTWPCT